MIGGEGKIDLTDVRKFAKFHVRCVVLWADCLGIKISDFSGMGFIFAGIFCGRTIGSDSIHYGR